MLLMVLLVAGALVVGVAASVWQRRWRRDRKALAILASELHTKARMDALTRATIQAMRAAGRER
jgi:hypothetical protein